jgi:hypothetical protein
MSKILFEWFQRNLKPGMCYMSDGTPFNDQPEENVKLLYQDSGASSAGGNRTDVWYHQKKKYILVIEEYGNHRGSFQTITCKNLIQVFNTIQNHSAGEYNTCASLQKDILIHLMPDAFEKFHQKKSTEFYKNFDIKNYLHLTELIEASSNADDFYQMFKNKNTNEI